MTDRSSSYNEIVASLVLFNLFERLCAGFMKWGSERKDFNNEFETYLIERMGKMRPPQASIRISEQISPLDTGLMPSALADYLLKKADKGPNELAFSNARIKALTMYNEFHELISIRNKVMHGFPAPEISAQIALRIASVMDAIAEILGEHLAKISKPNVGSRKADHTTWARLLFLTEDELLWIAKNGELPLGGLGKGIVQVPIKNEDTRLSTFFRRTDRLRKPSSSCLCLPEKLTAYSSLWVSTKSFSLEEIQRERGFIRSQAPCLLGLPLSSSKALVSELREGLEDIESDPFAIPWWQTAPDGKAYICIAL